MTERGTSDAKRRAADVLFHRLDDEQVEALLDVMETLAVDPPDGSASPGRQPALAEAGR